MGFVFPKAGSWASSRLQPLAFFNTATGSSPMLGTGMGGAGRGVQQGATQRPSGVTPLQSNPGSLTDDQTRMQFEQEQELRQQQAQQEQASTQATQQMEQTKADRGFWLEQQRLELEKAKQQEGLKMEQLKLMHTLAQKQKESDTPAGVSFPHLTSRVDGAVKQLQKLQNDPLRTGHKMAMAFDICEAEALDGQLKQGAAQNGGFVNTVKKHTGIGQPWGMGVASQGITDKLSDSATPKSSWDAADANAAKPLQLDGQAQMDQMRAQNAAMGRRSSTPDELNNFYQQHGDDYAASGRHNLWDNTAAKPLEDAGYGSVAHEPGQASMSGNGDPNAGLLANQGYRTAAEAMNMKYDPVSQDYKSDWSSWIPFSKLKPKEMMDRAVQRHQPSTSAPGTIGNYWDKLTSGVGDWVDRGRNAAHDAVTGVLDSPKNTVATFAQFGSGVANAYEKLNQPGGWRNLTPGDIWDPVKSLGVGALSMLPLGRGASILRAPLVNAGFGGLIPGLSHFGMGRNSRVDTAVQHPTDFTKWMVNEQPDLLGTDASQNTVENAIRTGNMQVNKLPPGMQLPAQSAGLGNSRRFLGSAMDSLMNAKNLLSSIFGGSGVPASYNGGAPSVFPDYYSPSYRQ